MQWIEEKYLRLISSRLRNFKQKDRELYNWSCHSCGDSKKRSNVARAYAYLNKKGKFSWTCHNCSDGGSVSDLVKSLDEDLFREMLMERFQDSDRGRQVDARRRKDAMAEEFASASKPQFAEAEVAELDVFKGLDASRLLSPHHELTKLLIRRCIPSDCWPDIYHADNYFAWAHRLTGKYPDLQRDEARMVLPFFRGERCIGFQGRSYEKSSAAKYITGVIDKEAPFLYGWNRLDGHGDVLAVEGPIDSMFLRNGVATGGGSIQVELAKSRIPQGVCIIVYDNEPRNRQVVRNMMKAVKAGYRVCVWPAGWQHKDVNDAVMGGIPAEQVQEVILRNAHAGMSAELMINAWKRVSI